MATACRGRFAAAQCVVEYHDNPPASHRCGGCVRANLQDALRELSRASVDVQKRLADSIAAYNAATTAFVEFMIAEALRVSARAEAFTDEREWTGEST